MRALKKGDTKSGTVKEFNYFVPLQSPFSVSSVYDLLCLSETWGLSLLSGGIRLCGDAVLLDFWCSFAEIFILSCLIAV